MKNYVRKLCCRSALFALCAAPWCLAQTTTVAAPAKVASPHKMIIAMPEPPASLLLIVDLVAVAGLVFVIRRRSLRAPR